MRKLSSGSRFFEFVRSQKSSIVMAVAVLCGAAILLISASGSREEAVSFESLEDRVAGLCSSVDGVGECTVMITYGEDDTVYAVAVLCEGAESASVRQRLTELASSLFGIGSNRISVLKLSK